MCNASTEFVKKSVTQIFGADGNYIVATVPINAEGSSCGMFYPRSLVRLPHLHLCDLFLSDLL